jgi:multisubunit Na+/H+ antiporter MnhG subunit
MALIEIRWQPAKRELRQFGGLLTLLFCGLAIWNYTAGMTLLAGYGALMLLVALVTWLKPGWLRPVYVTWMFLAFPVGWVVSHLILAGLFYLLMTPVGYLMAWSKYDPLRRRWDSSSDSYWEPRQPMTDRRRYFRQF